MSRFAKVASSALAVLLGGCSGFTETELDASVVWTDRAAYEAVPLSSAAPSTYAFAIVVRTENRGDQPLLLGRCTPESTSPIYDVRVVGGGESAYSPVWACPGPASPIVLMPGEWRDDSLQLLGPRIVLQGGQPVGALEGRMQLVFGDAASGLQSNTFRVTLAQ